MPCTEMFNNTDNVFKVAPVFIVATTPVLMYMYGMQSSPILNSTIY